MVKSREPFKFWRAQLYPLNGWSSQALSTSFAVECHKLLTVGGNVDHIHRRVCIQQLCRVEEMVFTARRSYASAVLGVVILSVCPSVRLSVCHTRALWLIQRTYRRYFYTTWKGNPCSQMWFFIQLCSSWQDFNWLKASRGLSAIADLLVYFRRSSIMKWNKIILKNFRMFQCFILTRNHVWNEIKLF